MSYLCYSDEPYAGRPIDYNKINANKGYLRHYDNALFLKLVLAQSRDPREKVQAGKELAMAENKMQRMEQHPNFDWAVVRPEVEKREPKLEGVRL